MEGKKTNEKTKKEVKKSGKKEVKKDADDLGFVEEELSEEDLELKKKLDLYVERLTDVSKELRQVAIDGLKNEVRSSTSSMTGVPKPFKFLKPHYTKIKETFKTYDENDSQKSLFADLVSVLAITMSEPGTNEALQYALIGTRTGITSWGHEYLRTLSGEISNTYKKRVETGGDAELKDLQFLIDEIIPFNMHHNAEPDAVDLCLEINRLPLLVDQCSEHNYERVCLYLLSCASYAADPEDYETCLNVCFKILRLRQAYPEALRVALKLNNLELIDHIMRECKDTAILKQMAFMIGRQRIPYHVRNEEINAIMGNNKLSENFKLVAKDLQVLEPKTVEQVTKSQFDEAKGPLNTSAVDSSKKLIAETYVNAFVNFGFGTDSILAAGANRWFPRNKDTGKFVAAASLGLIHMWEGDEGMNAIDKYLYVPDDNIIAGSYFAMGLTNCGIMNDFDPSLQILLEQIKSGKDICKLGSVLGLSFAYAGSNRVEILDALSTLVIDTNYSFEISAMSALCLGIVFVGSCNVDVLNIIMQGVTDREASTLETNKLSRYFALALGLVFLGQQDKIDASIEAVKVVPGPFGKFMTYTLTFCAYAATGNVLKIQEMLHGCNDHLEAKDSLHQIAAVLGIAIIAMGEEIGMEMVFRTMNHLLQYGEPIIRKTVPLAIALLSLSNPQISTMDILTKLTYDNDKEVAQVAIFALGLIGAGSNNSRLAELLRQQASYCLKDSDNLFIVRIAQGLLQMGKGLMNINPIHSDKFLLSNVGLAGILVATFAATDIQNIICANYHYTLFYLALAAYPRFCVTLNENLEPLPVPVRVGLAVDIAGQAGKPKTITGFQTHTAPVLLAYGERAELGTEEYTSLASVLENFVILKTNPDYIERKIQSLLFHPKQ